MNLIGGSKAGAQVILVHPIMKVADPNRTILIVGSSTSILLLLLRWMVVVVWVIGYVVRWVLHYHSRRRVLHRHPWLLSHHWHYIRLRLTHRLLRRG